MSTKILKILLYSFIIFLCVSLKDVFCDQPKFVSQKGYFEFQSARDKNITIRLDGSSNFLVNDINVLDSLQKASEQNKPLDENSIQKLPNQVQLLKSDVRRFTNRLRRSENRTSSLSMDRVRSLETRVMTLMTQVNRIIRKLMTSNACDSMPCQNGGTCYNLYEDYNCECPKAWTGKSCDIDIDECQNFAGTDLGCQNNSTCINLPGSYQCNCTNGFVGAHCRSRVTDCANSKPGELCGKGQCIPAKNAQGYECLCDAGWRYNNVTKLCSDDVNECLESLVPCHTSCINLPGAFACGPCPSGYSGNGLICRDIDECEKDNGGCSLMPKVQCINTEGSHHCGKCPPGWTGDGRYCSQAETYSCESTNICHPLARCEYISNVMVCICPDGLTGSGYGQNGCRSGSANPCNEHNCQNGGTCINRNGIATCICPRGFEPPNCELRTACATNPCLNGGTCHSRHNSNETICTCPLGYFGNRCQTSNAVCGSVITELSGQLTRPAGGGVYGANESCAWVIRTGLDLILNMTFSRFDIQFDATCSKDWLQINDGRSLATPVIGRFCGNELPNGGNILSSHNTLFLWFHTDYAVNAAGFSLNWTSVTPVCGGRFEVAGQGHGVIKSPGYPGKSPPNRECEWFISAPFGKRVLFRFFEVVMDNSANCTKDALLLYDSNEILERICETGIPSPKHSSTNSVKVHFHTDRGRHDSMFQIHYEVVDGTPGCGGLFAEPTGTLFFRIGFERCLFLIQQPVGMKISIVFSEGLSEDAYAYFRIYDGKTEDDPVLSTTTIDQPPGNLTSSGNSLLVMVRVMKVLWDTNEVTNTIISKADFKRVCGDDLRDPSGGTLSTPNYPKPYYSDLDCFYSIVGPVNSIVHLNITDYDISEYEQGCVDEADFVEISFALGGPPERHCKGEPRHFVSSSNFLNLAFHSNTNPQKRRGISAEYYFENIGCGGVLRDTVGSFELLSATSPTSAYCEWILEATDSHVISLDLTYRRAGTKCAQGEVDLRVFLNRTGTNEGSLVESHCGDEKRIVTILPTNLATVFLKLVPPSLGSAVTYGIRANYTFTPRSANCGGNYSLLSGSIQSPGWPNEYYESVDCTWVIHAPLGKRIEVIPKNFSLESSYGQCRDDFLEIRNGMSEQSPLIGRFCGNSIPPHIPSFTNHLYLHFHSDVSENFPGFDLTFQQTSTGCGGTLTSHTGSIASPHYPELSQGPIQCDWKITISQGSTIDIRITKIGPTANLCSNDVLTIYDGSDSMAKKIRMNCSSNGDIINLRSSENVIFVRYVLPELGAAEDQQFYLEYRTNCQQTLSSVEGVIESPNFPEPYPNSQQCEWTIEGRKSETISLTFSHFELESHDENCEFDKFQVIDMKGDEVLQTHKICREPIGILRSDGNKFVIKFSSDSSMNANGFRLEFKRNGCGGYKTGTTAWLASPNYPYSVDVDCEWFIEAPPGMQVVLEVADIHIEGGDGNCTTNGLIVRNEKSDTRNLLQACGTQVVPSTVTSHGSTMYVRFYSDSIRSRKYVRASSRRRTGQCGGIIRRSAGQILSPNYPHNYSANTYCEWMVYVGDASVHYDLEFSLENGDVSDSTNCSNDVLQIYDGLKSDKNSIPFDTKSMCRLRGGFHLNYFNVFNVFNVIFDSGNKPPGSGFILNYRKAKCGQYQTSKFGTLRANVNEGHCEWRIFVPEESSLVVTFTNVECHCDGLNSTECARTRGLTVKYSSKIYTHICENHPHDLTISTFGDVSFISDRITYSAKYTVTGKACGGYLSSLRGSLASPLYPESYPSNVECIWFITAPYGNFLELSFQEMNISSSENCNKDYLEVREKSMTGKLIGVFCANSLPTESIQAFEQIWLKFRSAEGSTGRGFRLSWTNAQMNEITGFSGKISSPSIVSIKSEKEPFQWRITVPRDNSISFNFKEYNGGLKLFDGFDTTAFPIEIQLSPWQVTSTTNVVYLMTDNQMLDQFVIEWKAVSRTALAENLPISSCNETIVLAYGTTIEISSPGYPTGYENNLNCQWFIKSDHPTRHAVVELYEVRLEVLNDCYADHLKIFSSNSLYNWHEELKICDSPPKGHKPVAKIHGTPNLKLELITDGSVNKTGFTSKVFTTCGGNLTGSIGRILDKDVISPGIDFYLQNCTWHIEVGTGRKIQFTFKFAENKAQNVPDDCANYALIRDGIMEGAPILPPGRICSKSEINGTIMSSTNRATVRYILRPKSPFLLYDIPLWNLTYREYSPCNGEVRLTSYSKSQIINSPNYPNVPDPHTECVWIVIAPPGETVQVEFIGTFDMNVRQCSKEFVEFRDGATEMARLLGKYCVKPGTIRSSGNILYLRYLTDIAEPRNGFKANVSLSTCGGTFTQFDNLITSANYPALGGYPANSICEYVVKLSTYSRVNLTFMDIDLPFDAANLNNSDHMRIYQILQGDSQRIEEELAVVYGNQTYPTAVEVDSNEVLIRFFSFKANSKFRGFKIKYERIHGACFKDVSGDSGVLSLNITPRQIAMFLLCRWKITVPKGKRVKVDIKDIVGGNHDISTARSFRTTFYNDFQMLSRITMLDLNNITQSTSILSSDNKMFIRIFGAYTTSLRRMRFEYSSEEPSNCPDDIDNDSGSFSVAGLQSTPAANFFCSFDFELNGAQSMAINVSRLVVENLDQRLPTFGLRVKDEKNYETLRILTSNLTNNLFSVSPRHGSISILQNDGVHVKELEATYKKNPCGGEYRLSQSYEVTMPNITTQTDYGSLDCAWQLLTTSTNGYDLSANFSFTLPCEDEFATIHAGPSSEHFEIAKLCQGQTLKLSRIRSTIIYVFYHTKSYNPNSQMSLFFQRATRCSEKINLEMSATEYLQFTAADYKNNIECVWDVETSEGYYLQVQFSMRFFIEDSTNCSKDYLEIRKFENNDWVSLPRYCGRNIPAQVNTTSTKLRLIFRSDEANTGDGFSLTIRKTCFAMFNVTNEPQIIKYPVRWSVTRLRMTCDYILQSTDPDKYIQVRFNKLFLGYRNRCSLTQLTAVKQNVGGDRVDLGPYCKDNAVSEMRAKNNISINYQAVLETRGYEIEFFLDNCGGDVRKPTWISSLQNEAGDRYANGMNCLWNITAPPGHIIVIRFKYFHLEDHSDCSLDYVSIYKGSHIASDNREAKLCGNLTVSPPNIHIADNSAIVQAISDSSVTEEGFSARILFSRACDERITLTQANSPVDIARNFTVGSGEFLDCSIRAMGPPGFRVEVEFKALDLIGQNLSCSRAGCESCEYLEIVDSLQADSGSLGRYCALDAVMPKVISSFKDVVVQTNFEKPGLHIFTVNLRLVPAECGSQSEYLLEDDGRIEIESQRGPNGLYNPNFHCIWKFTSKSDFEMTLTEFSLQNKSDVTGQCLDYVLIKTSDTYKPGTEHCGKIKSFVHKIERTYDEDAVAEVVFHTDENIESTGFKLTVSKTKFCNQTLTQTSGLLTGGIPSGEGCLNDILLPDNLTVNIYVPGFYLRDSNCSENHIRVIDKKTNRQIFEDCSEDYSGRKIYTSTPQVRLDLRALYYNEPEIYYYASPKAALQGCGGNLEMHKGYIMSPNYQEYKNSSVCRWNLTTTSPNRIEISFHEFNMGSVCKADYLNIIETAQNGTERVARHYCENDSAQTYISEGNRVSIVSVAAGDFDGTGWIIYFKMRSETIRKGKINKL